MKYCTTPLVSVSDLTSFNSGFKKNKTRQDKKEKRKQTIRRETRTTIQTNQAKGEDEAALGEENRATTIVQVETDIQSRLESSRKQKGRLRIRFFQIKMKEKGCLASSMQSEGQCVKNEN